MYSSVYGDNVGVIMYMPSISGEVTLNGISQVGYAYDKPMRNVNILGRQTSDMIMNGPLEVSLTVNKLFQEGELLVKNTGRNDLIAYVGHNMNSSIIDLDSIQTTGGAIQSLSVSATAGDIPSLSADIIFSDSRFYNNDANGIAYSGAPDLAYVPPTGVRLNLGYSSNVLISANYTANFNWVKEGRVGTDLSGDNRFMMELVRPVEYTASVEMAIDTYRISAFSFQNSKTWELSIHSDTALIHTFALENAELVGESVNLNAEGLQTVTLNYRGVG